ncbi:hypothetical protein EDB84DRAFT_1496266 [Lactarius hengduanensis]|nr:hypothetical protein EDB84DRAFT_1496266 [Lactarius hengduanensis]
MSSPLPSALGSPSPSPEPVQKKSSTRSKLSRSAKSTPKKSSTTKKPAAAKKPSTKKSTSKSVVEHPSWKDIIKEAIIQHPEDARSGVSRSTIKKYAEEKYKLDMTSASNLHQLNLALTRGAEKETFVFPKGPSGKVKLAPKRPRAPADTKEVCCGRTSPSIITQSDVEHSAPQEEYHYKESGGEDEGCSCKETY